MRAKTDRRFTVEVDFEQTMDALLVVEATPEWSDGHVDMRVAMQDDYGRPLRVYATVNPAATENDRQVWEYQCTADRIAWQAVESALGGSGCGWFELYEMDLATTEVWYHTEVSVPMAGILMKRTVNRIVDEAVHNLAEFIEKFPFDPRYHETFRPRPF